MTDDQGLLQINDAIPGGVYTLKTNSNVGVKFVAEDSPDGEPQNIIMPAITNDPSKPGIEPVFSARKTLQQTINSLKKEGQNEAAEFLYQR